MNPTPSTTRFLLCTFIPSYLLGTIYYWQASSDSTFASSVAALILLLVYMWIPALVVLILNRHQLRQALALYGVSFRPNLAWLGAWLYPLAIVASTIGICLLFHWGKLDLEFAEYLQGLASQLNSEQLAQASLPFTTMEPSTLVLLMVLQSLVAGSTINAIAAFGEELGWRGLLYHNLAGLGFWRANLLIGFIWGLWHAPLIAAGYNFPQHPYTGILVMVVATMALSLLIGYVRERSGSVIAAAIFHGVLNAIAGLPIILIAGTSNIYRSPLGVAGIIGMLLLIAVSYALFGLGHPLSNRTAK